MRVRGGAGMRRPPTARSWLSFDSPPEAEVQLLKRCGVLRTCDSLVSLYSQLTGNLAYICGSVKNVMRRVVGF